MTDGLDITKPSRFTSDEVLEQIRSKQEEDDEKSAKFRVAKEGISKTRDRIYILGGIASQAASMVGARCLLKSVYVGNNGENRLLSLAPCASMLCPIYFRLEQTTSVSLAVLQSFSDASLIF